MISIIIVNWNGLDDTIECIDSILASEATGYEIYLIDNDSQNGEYEALQKKYGAETHINLSKNPTNLGFTKAHISVWEEQLQIGDAKYLVLINNDTTVHPNWLQPLINASKEHDADIVSCKMINYYDHSQMDNAGHQLISTGEIIPIGHKENPQIHDAYRENHGACAGACLYSRSMLNEIGFFDPHFDTGYEDAELGVRATVLGYKGVYCPDSIIYHKGGQSIKKVFNEEYAIKTQRNVLYTFYKLMPLLQVIIYTFIIALKTFSIIVASLLLFKWNYARIMTKSTLQFIKYDLSEALRARRALYSNRLISKPFHFYLSQKSFILFEIRRLYSHLILRKSSALDKYR